MIQLRKHRADVIPLRRWAAIVCSVLAASLWIGCTSPQDPASGKAPVAWHFKIQGMHCNGCAGGIRSELVAVPGVFSAKVRYPEADAEVKVDPTRVEEEQLIKVIQEAGYQAIRVP